jgi:hypothetical protein
MTALDDAIVNRAAVGEIKRLYMAGIITRHQAQILAEPVILRINEQGARVAKKWKKRHIQQTFIGLMR